MHKEQELAGGMEREGGDDGDEARRRPSRPKQETRPVARVPWEQNDNVAARGGIRGSSGMDYTSIASRELSG